MKFRLSVFLALLGFLVLVLITSQGVNAQIQGQWSEPYQLSTVKGKASEASLATDVYGYVHAFWSESLEDQSSILYYARFDGGGWTTPLDLYKTRPFVPIQSVTPAIDQHGILHVIWSGADIGPLYYIQAPAANALSAHQWTEPRAIDIPAKQVRLLIDNADVMHLLYGRTMGDTRGVYYTRSDDFLETWSRPIWLDPDILPGYMAGLLQFKMDENGGLHALWHYTGFSVTGGDWVRYAHSLDGGATWSLPFTIDKVIEGADYELSAASPVMAVSGQTVHVVWAGGSLHYRHHRISTDAGRTWGPARRIFGELNGQAFEGLTTDGKGRVHYLGQIRYPRAIYHAIWDNGQWTRPEIVYLIGLTESDPLGDRVHAHHTLSTVRAGNQLVLTFTDNPSDPQRRLFATYRTLEDVEPGALVATPTPTPTPVISPTPTPTVITPTTVATMPPATLEAIAALPPADMGRPDQAIWIGLLLPLVLLLGTVIIWLISRYRKETA
jgi:hypothetical protein